MIQTDSTQLAVAQALITLRDENRSLKAENERLKAALKTIMQNAEFWDDEDDSLAVIHKVASEALTATA